MSGVLWDHHPPIPVIHSSTIANLHKVSPNATLVLVSSMSGIYRGTSVRRDWELWRTSDGGNIPLSLADATSVQSTVKGPNLVIAPSSLHPGSAYRIRLTTTTLDGSAGSAELTITVNLPPANGSRLAVHPTVGTSIANNFTLVTDGWKDSDLPLSYTFFLYTFQDDDTEDGDRKDEAATNDSLLHQRQCV